MHRPRQGLRYVLSLLWIAHLGCLNDSAPTPGTAVKQEEAVVEGETLIVQLQPWPQVAKVQGSFAADELAVIAAKVAGRVVEVNCDLGDQVVTGQPLIKLDTADYELLAAQAEAQLTQVRAAVGLKEGDAVENLNPMNAPPVREGSAVLDEAKQAVKRLEKLFSQGAIVATDLEVAQAAATVADARYNSALNSVREKIALIGVQTAQRALAEDRLRDTTISAPFSGMIQNRTVAVGSYVNVGQPVVELVHISVLRYRAAVPERYVSSLKIGQRVELHLHGQENREVRVTRISPALDPASRSLLFEAAVPNEDGALRSGSFAQADIVLDEDSQTIAVPNRTVMRFAGVDKVWRIVDGKVAEAVVQIGREQDGLSEILAGLKTGDIVLADGRSGRTGRFQTKAVDSAVAAPAIDAAAEVVQTALETSTLLRPSGDASSTASLEVQTSAEAKRVPPSLEADSASRSTAQSALGR